MRGASPLDLDEYRDGAERFLRELEEESYRHYAGLKERLELEPIYERHSDLMTLDSCRWLEAQAQGALRPRGGVVELWRLAATGYLRRSTCQQDEAVADLQAALTAQVDGEAVGFRMLRPRLANEPDRDRRERLEETRAALTEELNPHLSEALERTQEGARELGGGTYRQLYERFGFPLGELAGECERFLAETEDLYAAAFGSLLRARLGAGLAEVRSCDLPRLLRAARWDAAFPANRMVAALEHTLADLGIELGAQRNVQLDVERRPTKSPRAFSATIDVPGRIVLVLQPIGGYPDWLSLFHEAGHAEHFAHTSPRLPLEARKLGDDAVTETWAFLFDHLVSDPAWLSRRLDVARPDELAREEAAAILYAVRRSCAMLLYELELHGNVDAGDLPSRYGELLREATKIEPSPTDYLADVDRGFYVSNYLRAWALEARLSAYLREEYGRAWFADRKAGSLLRELWNEGQGLDADDLAREVTGSGLELAAVAERIEDALNA